MWRKKEIAEKVEQDNEDITPEIVFAPGCFDHFDGTQEELDALKDEILAMFAGKTTKEIMAESRVMDVEDIMELPEEVQQQIADTLNGVDITRKLH